ncbi:MAG: TetR/AcrR family transcriptional regulator [Phenylobacterium sp.]|nr:TetR/AcrR family transcriptional regulator [Phenylobacterium sp.]
MNSTAPPSIRRAYRQAARAEAAETTGRRIVEAFHQALRAQWLEDITLDQVAREAEVSVQTVIRRFGGKQGLLEAVGAEVEREVRSVRGAPRGDLRQAVENLCADYEATGDMILRLLAQEPRYPALTPLLDYGRAQHRGWVAEVAEPWLERLRPERREAALDALVTAMDVYVWKLARRDWGRSLEDTRDLVLRLATGALATFFPTDPH